MKLILFWISVGAISERTRAMEHRGIQWKHMEHSLIFLFISIITNWNLLEQLEAGINICFISSLERSEQYNLIYSFFNIFRLSSDKQFLPSHNPVYLSTISGLSKLLLTSSIIFISYINKQGPFPQTNRPVFIKASASIFFINYFFFCFVYKLKFFSNFVIELFLYILKPLDFWL